MEQKMQFNRKQNNKMRIQKAILLLIFTKLTKCDHDHKESKKSKNPLPYFRRYVEGVPEDFTSEPLTDDLSSNLVSLLVKNAKEIFDVLDENEVVALTTTSCSTGDFTPNKSVPKEETFTYTHDVMLYENLSLNTSINGNPVELLLDNDNISTTEISEFMKLTKEFEFCEKSNRTIDYVTVFNDLGSNVLETTDQNSIDLNYPKRSCIFCDNILSENCNDPQNTLIPTVVCEHYGDICYSQHTPFGVIERGCYNVNHNLSTFVCSCNLCNYISISEMPYIFSNSNLWIDNVVELSRARNFRKSLSEDMSCLRCEVNTTNKMGDIFDSANCLKGNIESLPKQNCDKNEICAVKAVRRDGYIWRGCVKTPLYNYWWTLCDTDLCNYDSIFSMYDFVL